MPIDKILVFDFEATCISGGIIKPQEIIEFPCIILDVKTKKLDYDNVFHEYINPVHHPTLTDFCKELTGIQQEMVENADTFSEVWTRHLEWLKSNSLYPDQPSRPGASFVYLSCGDWDLAKALPAQCQLSGITLPHCFKKWINIKKAYESLTGIKAGGMPQLLNKCKLELEGRHHSGIDDTKNIARCAKHMLEKLKWKPEITSK